MAECLCCSLCIYVYARNFFCICLVSVKCKEKNENVYFEVGSAYTSDCELSIFTHFFTFLFDAHDIWYLRMCFYISPRIPVNFCFLLTNIYLGIIIRCSNVENSFIYFQKHFIYGQNYIALSQTKLTFRAYK